LGSTAGRNTLLVRADGLTGFPITFTATATIGAPAGSGCFLDDQGRTYCVDPGFVQ
jgi:hypothetical protein